MNRELKLHELYGESFVKSSTIYKYIAEAKFSPEALEKHEKPGPERDFQLLMRIKEVLDEMLFASSHVIADTLQETQSIVYRYLTNELWLVYKHSSWIPRNLDFQQKRNCVSQTKELLSVLMASKHQSFRDNITGDQSWFGSYY